MDNNPNNSQQVRILLVDDDQIILESLGTFLELEGYQITKAGSAAKAMDCLQAGWYHLVITDVCMPSGGGMDLLRFVKSHHSDTVVILVTAYGSIELAVEAIKQGAYDYLTKPIIDDDVRLSVQRALQQQHLMAENRRLRLAIGRRDAFEQIVSHDYRMAKVFELIDAVADSRSTVLISGESGTGKSLIARSIHMRSPRRDKPFVEVSCGALSETLLESELFGHVRGAFTNALADRQGKFQAADGGTIFLDEIASASPQLQTKLLRVLQQRQFEPVGSNQTLTSDVRIIVATNRDLRGEVEAGRFRQDLLYRINVVTIELPPIRQRLGDIPLLAEHFLARFLAGTEKKILGFSTEAMDRLVRHNWPGNIRELENCIERGVMLCRTGLIDVADLPETVTANAPQADLPPSVNLQLKQILQQAERQAILSAIQAHHGNRRAAASALGINRATLYKKMGRLGLLP